MYVCMCVYIHIYIYIYIYIHAPTASCMTSCESGVHPDDPEETRPRRAVLQYAIYVYT